MTKKITKLIVNGVEYGFKEAIKPITSAGIYRNAQLGVISLSSDGTNWLTIADKNLGATQVYNDGDTLSQANCGNYYQWGNNYGFPFTGAVTTSSSQVDASSYAPLTYYSSSTFITRSGSPYDWSSNQNDNLWGGVTNTNDARRGPCAEGYHIPSDIENVSLISYMQSLGINVNNGVCMKTYLKMPFAGIRSTTNSNAINQTTHGLYWSTDASGTDRSYQMYFTTSALNAHNSGGKSNALSIRPFYNTPTAPDENWTVLYQGTGNAGIYHNATLGLISISSDGTNWITIADKNLGATQVYNDGDTLSEANCGKYYQWGNNYGFPFSGSVTTSSTQVSTVGYGGIGYYSSSTFITQSSSPYDWSSVNNRNLWGAYRNMLTEKGPCGDGYHIPASREFTELLNIGVSISARNTGQGTNISNYLKLPLFGVISFDGNIYFKGDSGHYWTSEGTGQYSYKYVIYKTGDGTSGSASGQRAQALPIRPFANTPIQPDSSWEKLY